MPKSGHFQGQQPIRLVLAAVVLAAPLAGTALAHEVETTVPGRVVAIEDAGGFDLDNQLAQRGMRVDTVVSIRYAIDVDAAAAPVGGGTGFDNGLVSIAVSGGLYQASYALTDAGAAPSSIVSVDGLPDTYTVIAPTASDSGDVLRGGPGGAPVVVTLLASDAAGAAMSDEAVLQDVEAFPSGSVTVTIEGDAGRVVIEIGDPIDFELTALCRSGQIAAASKYAGAYLKCRGKRAAKPSTSDLGGEKEAKCLARARTKFEAAFRKAVARALKKGGTCVLGEEDTVSTADRLGVALAALTDELLRDADRLDKDDRTLRGKLLKAASAQAAKDLKAYANHAKKPDQVKLDRLLLKNRDKTLRLVGKALDKATAKEIDIGTISPLGLATSVRSLVDAYVRDAGGS